jgi:hypothetical protein
LRKPAEPYFFVDEKWTDYIVISNYQYVRPSSTDNVEIIRFESMAILGVHPKVFPDRMHTYIRK